MSSNLTAPTIFTRGKGIAGFFLTVSSHARHENKAAFPIKVKQDAVSAKIRKVVKSKNGTDYTSYIVDYVLLGKRRPEWRADLAEARQAAADACKKMLVENTCPGSQEWRRMTYLRSTEAVSPLNVPIDTACREYAEMIQILNGRRTKGNCRGVLRSFFK